MNFKKSLTVFIAVILFTSLISSCGDDKDDNPESIVGTWEHKAESGIFVIAETSHPAFTEVIKAYIEKYMTDTEEYSFIFTKEGKYQFIENGSLKEYGSYIYQKDTVTLILDEPVDEYNATWDLPVNLSRNTFFTESDITSGYSSEDLIKFLARSNEELKNIDPSLIKVSKIAIAIKFTRK